MEADIYCPITGEIFLNPVIAADGICYERSAIKQWLKTNSISPTTKKKINKNLYDCVVMRKFILEHLQKNPDLVEKQFTEVVTNKKYTKELVNALIHNNQIKVLRALDRNLYDIDPHKNLHDGFRLIHIFWFYASDTDKICELKSNKLDLDVLTDKNRHILFIEAVRGNPRILEIMADKFDINMTDNKNKTPLMLAIKYNNFECVKFLLSKGADYLIENEKHLNAIHYAIKYSIPVLKYMTELSCIAESTKTPLHINLLSLACRLNNIVVFRYLIQHIDLNLVDVEGDPVLHKCIAIGKYEYANLLMETGVNLHSVNVRGYSTLQIAINYFDDYFNIDLLIAASPDINWQNEDGKTAIYYAVESCSNLTITEKLIDVGANINIPTYEKKYPIFNICREMNINVEQFMKLKPDFTVVDYNGDTILHLACRLNLLPMAKLALDHGVDVNTLNQKQRSAIFYTYLTTTGDITKLLLDSGAKFDIVDNKQNQPLHYHLKQHISNASIRVLIEAGADVNADGPNAKRPIQIIMKNYCANYANLQLLVDGGLDMNFNNNIFKKKTNMSGRLQSYLIFLMSKGCISHDYWFELVSESRYFDIKSILLVKSSTYINLINSDNKTALSISCQKDDIEIVKLLIEYGADTNYINHRGESLLHVSCRHKSIKTVKYLIEIGLDISARDNRQRQPIHNACRHVSTFEYLMDHNADLTSRDNEANTPLDLAKKYNKIEIIKLITGRGVNE